MSHSIELKDCNVIIIANDFNVTIINNIWLYKNNIFTEDELKNAISLPIHVEVPTKDFIFNVVPNQLQFSINPTYIDAKKIILLKIGKVVELLPHTPFAAVGLNFTYHVTSNKNDAYGLSRSLFCNEKAKLFDGLDATDIRFGGYFSQNLMGTRFRLDAKPVTITKDGLVEEKIQFAYNFNVNLTAENPVKDILDLFGKWDEAKEHTEQLTNKINLKD